MKIRPSAFGLMGLVIAASFVCGCFTTAKPEAAWSMVMAVQPKAVDPTEPTVVDSLQPVLEWTKSVQKGVLYDVAVYECFRGPHLRVGDLVYYKEALDVTQLRVETPLKPEQLYCWSVRIRTADKVYEWSRYNFDRTMVFPGAAMHEWANSYFVFRTPRVPKT